ncbi:MAG: aldo/keto reductase family protein [Planctomycetes bacterium]|nr:aldo/keto reductase family protein [Planctomycetota bacterium]
MKYRRLGECGLKVSTISLGSWLTYGNAVDDAAGRECVRAALDAGVNFFDTADVYAKGAAESFLGKALAGVRRSEIVLGTKVFGRMSDEVNDAGLSRKHIMESCEASLRRLKVDYLDLYQCHRHDPETPMTEVVRAMDDLIRQGKILYWGVSCWDAETLREACETADRLLAPRPISNQPQYSLLQRDIEEDVIPASSDLGIGQVVFSPLAQGILTGKYLNGAIPADSRLANDKLNKFMKDRVTDENLTRVKALGELASELGTPLCCLALAWCLRTEAVSSVITGATKPEQVRANCLAADLELSDEALAQIQTILETK